MALAGEALMVPFPPPVWKGPRTICSLCGTSLPCPKVPPRAVGAHAVSGYFCPRCDSVPQRDKGTKRGRFLS